MLYTYLDEVIYYYYKFSITYNVLRYTSILNLIIYVYLSYMYTQHDGVGQVLGRKQTGAGEVIG